MDEKKKYFFNPFIIFIIGAIIGCIIGTGITIYWLRSSTSDTVTKLEESIDRVKAENRVIGEHNKQLELTVKQDQIIKQQLRETIRNQSGEIERAIELNNSTAPIYKDTKSIIDGIINGIDAYIDASIVIGENEQDFNEN